MTISSWIQIRSVSMKRHPKGTSSGLTTCMMTTNQVHLQYCGIGVNNAEKHVSPLSPIESRFHAKHETAMCNYFIMQRDVCVIHYRIKRVVLTVVWQRYDLPNMGQFENATTAPSTSASFRKRNQNLTEFLWFQNLIHTLRMSTLRDKTEFREQRTIDFPKVW